MYLTNKDNYSYWIMDLEANGLTPTRLWCVCVLNLLTDEKYDLIGHEEIKKWIGENWDDKSILVGHNAISYDIPVLNRLLGLNLNLSRVVDTLVLSNLYSPRLSDQYGKHSLEAYGERFGIKKVQNEDWSRFTPQMLERCQVDVAITRKLLEVLRSKMLRVGFSEKSCEIEHGIREVINWQEKNGFYFDVPEAIKLRGELLAKEQECHDEVVKLFPPELKVIKTLKYRIMKNGQETAAIQKAKQEYPQSIIVDNLLHVRDRVPFNLGSPLQRLQRLQELGYTAVNKTKGGAPAVDEDGLLAFLEVCREEYKKPVQSLADWLVVSSRARVIGEWLDFVDWKDSCIHGRVFTCGANSRRATHNHPNGANIPANEAKYGAECRDLWRARPGRVLIGGDAKAVQMRMFAHYLGNIKLGMEYVEGDPHTRNAEAAGIPRRPMKNCFYALLGGAQDYRLGVTGHGGAGTKKQGEKIRKALYKTTPGLEELFVTAEKLLNKNNGWLECIDGGWVRCPSPHSALLYWFQSGEKCLMSLTAIYVYRGIKKWKLDAKQVGWIHDELQYDCKDLRTAALVGKLFLSAIERAGRELKFCIPQAGDTKYGLTWKFTH